MAERSQTFRTVLQSTGGTNVGIVVPDAVVAAFDHGKRVAVVVTIDGTYEYPNTVSPMGGRYLISFNAATRRATGRAAGDEIEVRLDLDEAPRVVEPPAELAELLRADDAAKVAWDKLSYSHQRKHADSISSAKSAATRSTRLANVIKGLHS